MTQTTNDGTAILKNKADTPVLMDGAVAGRDICRWMAASAAAIGALALVGWAENIALLKSIHPAWTPMKVNAAICLILAAAGIGCLGAELTPPWRRRAGQALGAVVGLIGVLTILEYALGWDLGLDQLLAHDPSFGPDRVYPGRMSPLTAIAFILTGAALLLLGVGGSPGVTAAHVSAAVMFMLVYFGLAGYALGVEALYRWAHMSVAFPTLLGLGALSLAVLFARPSSRLMAPLLSSDIGGVLARRLLPAILIIPLVIGMLRLRGEQAGLYGAPAGVALMVLTTTSTLLALTWWTSWLINRLAVQTAELARFPAENPNPVLRVGRDRTLLYSNAGAHGLLRKWGCEAGQPVPPEVGRWIEAAWAADGPFETEVAAENKVFALLFSPVAEHGYVNVLGRDITERRQAEEMLGRQAALIDLSPDAIIVRTFEGRITFWSKGAADLYGWTQAEAVGATTHALLQTQFPISFEEVLAQLARDEFWSGELIHTTKTGGRVVVDSRWIMQRNAQGHPIALMESNVDITERKRMEEELRSLSAELERRVEQRTAELETANRELEAFSYSISHDLRAPLRHIQGFIELLGKNSGPGLDDKGRRYVQVISEAARRMGNLIDDLLTFSRIGRTAMAQTRVSLDQLVDEARQELAPETQGRAIEWRIEPLPQVRGDSTLLRTVMVNLLSNAIKYTRPRNPARIEVGSREEGGEVICYVRDNGAGFEMRFVDKLFGVFQRLHRPEEFEGTGIGLASVRRIIQRHGGRTWAEGEVDRGATFYISLPGKDEDP